MCGHRRDSLSGQPHQKQAEEANWKPRGLLHINRDGRREGLCRPPEPGISPGPGLPWSWPVVTLRQKASKSGLSLGGV